VGKYKDVTPFMQEDLNITQVHDRFQS